MQTLKIDFITSLDGYGAAQGWPGLWGVWGQEYLDLARRARPRRTTRC